MSYFVIPTPEEIQEFVRQSNAIEGITQPEGHPLFADHAAAVYFVIKSLSEKGIVPTPKEIHAILLRSQPDERPGEYRSANVWIGKIGTPSPYSASILMENLLNTVNAGIDQRARNESRIWDIHNELEAIHPFMDGNGRTGRIWMNAMRLRRGLSWLIIPAEKKQEYYSRINEFRQNSRRYARYLLSDGQTNVETICDEPTRPLI